MPKPTADGMLNIQANDSLVVPPHEEMANKTGQGKQNLNVTASEKTDLKNTDCLPELGEQDIANVSRRSNLKFPSFKWAIRTSLIHLKGVKLHYCANSELNEEVRRGIPIPRGKTLDRIE